MTDRAKGWLVDLRPAERWDDEACCGDLPAEETRMADRLCDSASAATYIRARSVIRRGLAGLLGEPPAEIRLASEVGGRPVLPDHPDWYVSWSRSKSLLLLAARYGEPVGVDLEVIRPISPAAGVLRTVYPRTAELGAVDQSETFFTAWTLLEAAVKATGRGLARGARDVWLYRPSGESRCALGGIRNAGEVPWSGRTEQFAVPGSSTRVMTAVVTRGFTDPIHLHAWQLPDRPPSPVTAAAPRRLLRKEVSA
ncbi:4'-phosphopantetheinyl transferase family protein [Streptomyces bobili]